ncbi:replication-relaxation family protein [Plantactinospora sp. S1510]|uniref:Replication-relaxation family protein n=1 Tax=Plantactinospora alkalitolerans TaxID=2789879 RepID=A0ABS0H4R5_9ACTN|nr:replication-relaxation family protein [Plantactinospora alkalitolerans]MBF9133334.1 replication-relaxation family protein [Plantactinospora alkalitolerans]
MSDQVLRVQSTLIARDYLLLDWLADHGVLTTPQIAHALFPSLDFAQRRLRRLRNVGVVDRFRPLKTDGGTYPYHYVLDQLGAEIVAAQRDHPPPRPSQTKARRRRWTVARVLAHRLGVNQFFTDLAGHARTHPDHELQRWWPETRCREPGALAGPDALIELLGHPAPIHPDGHGVWRADNRRVPFFLEYDTGTEPLTELVRKLAGYQRMAQYRGPRWPVLFWLHSAERAHHLHQRLAEETMLVPVATASRDHADRAGSSPAGPLWWLHHHHGLVTLASLAEALPYLEQPEHGPDAIGSPPSSI